MSTIWASFFGALIGAALGTLALVGVLSMWDYLEKLRKRKGKLAIDKILDSFSEKQLEDYIVEHFDTLFPGWQIYDEIADSVDTSGENKPKGKQYPIKNVGRIDLLCLNRQGDLVVIELKRELGHSKPARDVVTQITTYMRHVNKKLAEPGQRVKGLILAKSLSDHLDNALPNRSGIQVRTYEWQLKLSRHRRQQTD